MKSLSITILVIFFLLQGSILSQSSDQKSISVTVYNQNLGVIKDLRRIEISSGMSLIRITDVAQQIDPTSVHIKLDGEVLEQNYQYDLVSLDKILKKFVNQDIQLISEQNEIVEGKLLSAFGGQIVLEKQEGGLIMLPNVNKYRFSVDYLPEGLITQPTLVWQVNSNSSGKQDVELSYQTKGMNWHAEYVVVLNEDDTELDLNSWVSVDNQSGATYKNAKLKLVAGDLNLIKKINIRGGRQGIYTMEKSSVSDQQFQEKAFFEYHIYNLQRPTTLSNNETKQISLFEASNVAAKKKYFYGSISNRWYWNQQGQRKVAVIVEFENSEEYGLGVPMPKGKVRVYKSDGESLEFIGEDLIDHTPKKEKVRLKIGDAFDIVAEEVQTENTQISSKVWEQEFEITFKNRKKINVVIEVERNLGTNWDILKTSIDYKKKDAFRVIFNVPVKADSETKLIFRVRYRYF
ncbi:MAG: DUF4139 domain-containing protein [Ignavibacteria bacterium]|nr:DUF4139 domain-containing protein [Ignavibacteria bacterium]